MTQYKETVRTQKMRLEAEAWANQPQSMHTHKLKSMWYDDRPQDTDDSHVTDIHYNDGRVERTIHSTGQKVMMNTKNQRTGEDLIYEYARHNPSKS